MSAGATAAATTTAAALTIADIDAPFHDARSDQLTYSLVEPRITPLATASADVQVAAPDGTTRSLRVELGVLGTSHQVTVTLPEDHRARGRVLVRETLACLSADARGAAAESDSDADAGSDPGADSGADADSDAGAGTAGPVPPHRRSRLATGTIDVAHTVHEPADLSGDVAAALASASAMEVSCAAGFPGDPDALTILGCDADDEALVWRTWHSYPQAGEIVETRTRFVPGATR